MTAARKPSARTLATRAKLVATAEELFANQGISSVSLNEITRAAEQKNRNAVHYHFGDKESLITAIFEKHAAPISAMREAMLEAIDPEADSALEAVVAALIRPVAARLDDTDGGVAYIKISAQMAAANMLRYFHDRAGKEISPEHWPSMARLWGPHLQHLPQPIQDHRMSLMVSMMFHGLADHADMRDSDEPDLANTELMVSNLIDSVCALLRAPVSEQTAEVLKAR